MEDRGAYLIIGFTDEGSSFEYTEEKAQIIEQRLIPLLQAENSPYKRFIMRVPGFGTSANSYNSFIIIALLDHWKNRDQDSQTVMRQAIGKIVTVPQASIQYLLNRSEFQVIISSSDGYIWNNL